MAVTNTHQKMIKKIGIIGAGTMGQSIATSFAMYNYDVHLYDVSAERLQVVKSFIQADLKLLASEEVIKENDIDNYLVTK